ncbi:MAG: GNAT family protein [Alphaproteobacteria bacterium]|nr:GNAT family protein [Alphaproteobacteria bacterium]
MLDFDRLQSPTIRLTEFAFYDYAALKAIAHRINLKAATAGDAGYMPYYAFQGNPLHDAGYARDLGDNVRKLLAKAGNERRAQPRTTYRLAVRLKQWDVLIGGATINMLPVREDGREIHGDLGYFLDPAHARHGHMRQACRLLLGQYFEHWDTLDITTHPGNIYSKRLIGQLGGTFAGRQDASHYAGEPRDAFVVTRQRFHQRPEHGREHV